MLPSSHRAGHSPPPTLLHSASCGHGEGKAVLYGLRQWAPLPCGFLLGSANGEAAAGNCRRRMRFRCPPQPPVRPPSPQRSFLVFWTQLPSLASSDLHVASVISSPGALYLHLLVSLSPAHIFVNSPFIKLSPNYPVGLCHLFPAETLTYLLVTFSVFFVV